jgi:hypothetical protein
MNSVEPIKPQLPPELQRQLTQLELWWNSFVQKFPTAEFVKVDERNNILTIKIRYDDVFRYYYDILKKQFPDAKIAVRQCAETPIKSNDVSKYGLCCVVKVNKILTGWDQYGLKPIEINNNDGYYYYILPLEQLFQYFIAVWKAVNADKPMRFEFDVRKAKDETPWLYVRIVIPRTMGRVGVLHG